MIFKSSNLYSVVCQHKFMQAKIGYILYCCISCWCENCSHREKRTAEHTDDVDTSLARRKWLFLPFMYGVILYRVSTYYGVQQWHQQLCNISLYPLRTADQKEGRTCPSGLKKQRNCMSISITKYVGRNDVIRTTKRCVLSNESPYWREMKPPLPRRCVSTQKNS